MSDQQQTAQGSAATESLTGKRFQDMDGSEKLKFFGKIVIFLITGGMLCPNVFVD